MILVLSMQILPNFHLFDDQVWRLTYEFPELNFNSHGKMYRTGPPLAILSSVSLRDNGTSMISFKSTSFMISMALSTLILKDLKLKDSADKDENFVSCLSFIMHVSHSRTTMLTGESGLLDEDCCKGMQSPWAFPKSEEDLKISPV